jgi:predicted ribosomally synthesized peptide with nif11-like leader
MFGIFGEALLTKNSTTWNFKLFRVILPKIETLVIRIKLMSKENLSAFYQAFRTDLSLQQQLEGITDPSEYVNKAVSLGASRGFEFTHEEVEAAIANPSVFLEESIGDELSDLELAIVAGGLSRYCRSKNT